jgi:serine/threonine protein kinase
MMARWIGFWPRSPTSSPDHAVRAPNGEGQLLGKYELVNLLGRGGMGDVWRARHTFLGRHAAVKRIQG